MSSFDADKLVPFLLDANRAGYANDRPEIEKLPDGTRRIVFEQGDYRFEDIWWGGSPFAGQEAVAIGGKVLWAMQYRGGMEPGFETLQGETFTFLRQALKHCTAEEPFRGPAAWEDGEFFYHNRRDGNVKNFAGTETILRGNDHIYTCNYLGGVVDL